MGALTPIPNLDPDKLKEKLQSGLHTVEDTVSKGIHDYAEGFHNSKYNPANLGTPDQSEELRKQPAKAPTIIDKGSYKSLADLQAHGFEHDKRLAQVAAARQLKDPTQAPTPELKMQAVAGKLQRVYDSPEYQGLRPENKLRVKAVFYSRYIVPAMKVNAIEPPSLEEWLAGYGSEKVYEGGTKARPTLGQGALANLASGAKDSVDFAHNMLDYAIGGKPLPGFEAGTRNSRLSKFIDRNLDDLSDIGAKLQSVDDSYQSAFATRHDPAAWLTNFGAKNLGSLPAYLAVGAAGEEVLPSLAEKSTMSKTFKIGYSSLKAAADVFLVDKGEGRTTGEAGVDAAGAAILGPALVGAAALVGKGLGRITGRAVSSEAEDIESEPGLSSEFKDLGKDKAKEGGEDYIRDKAEEAGLIGIEKAASGGTLARVLRFKQAQLALGGESFVSKVETSADKAAGESSAPRIKALVNEADPDFKATVKAEQAMREQLAREFHPEKAEKFAAGSGDASVWRNLSKGQRQKIKDYISASTQEGAELMPLTHPTIQTAANITTLTDAIKENPEFGARFDRLRQVTGLEPAEVLTKMQARAVAKEKGLLDPALEIKDALEHAKEKTKKKIAADLGSYLPTVSGGTSSASAAKADKSLLKPSITTAEFNKGTMKYLESTPATKSGKFYFEDPKQQLLYVAHNQEIPELVRKKAFALLRKDFNISAAQAKTQAGWLAEKYSDLKDTGLFKSEGNMFQSTKLTQRRYGTQYDKELYQADLPAADIQFAASLLRKHPELKKSVTGLIKELNKLRNKAATPVTSKLRRSKQKALLNILDQYR